MSFKNLERKCKHRNSLTLSLLLTFWEIKLTACSLLKQNHKLINGLSFNTQATFTVLWHHKALLVLIFVPLPWFVSPPPPFSSIFIFLSDPRKEFASTHLQHSLWFLEIFVSLCDRRKRYFFYLFWWLISLYSRRCHHMVNDTHSKVFCNCQML